MNKKTIVFMAVNSKLILISIILLIIGYFCMPFPERFFIEDMDEIMLELGQQHTLFVFYFFGALLCLSFLIHLVSTIIFFTKNYSKFTINIKNKFLNVFSKIIFLFFYFILPFFFIWYVYLIFLKQNKSKYTNAKWIISLSSNNQIKKKNKFLWFFGIFFICFSTIFSFSFVAAWNLLVEKNYVRKESIENYFKVSNNNPNTFLFYFDRSQGVLWNLLLVLDKYLNNENSFVKLFPEFNSYVNSLTLSNITSLSNPIIYSGAFSNPLLKNTDFKINDGPFKNKMYKDLNINEFYLNSLYKLINMFSNLNTKRITLNNLPFYGKQIGMDHGDLAELEGDLNNYFKGSIEINGTTNCKLVNKFNYYNKSDKWSDSYIIDNLDNALNFVSTSSGTFFSNFSQITHENYSWKENGKYVTAQKPKYIINSMWFVLQSLKKIFVKLKTTNFLVDNKPILGQDNKPISIYDKSQIVILSDHGSSMQSYLNELDPLFNFLNKNNEITTEQINILKKFKNYPLNPIITYKKFKYNIDNELIDDQINNELKFDVDKIIALSDIPIILENSLKKYNKVQNHDSEFILKNVPAKFDFIKNMIIDDPLDYNKNNINMTSRKIYIVHPTDWRFFWYRKDFLINYKRITMFENKNKSIFWDNNFTNVA